MNRYLSTAGLFLLLVSMTFAPISQTFGQKKKGGFAPIKDDPKLPRVLLIGDSISIGYTLQVRALLKGKANVHRPGTNCGPTTRGLQEIDQWLGDKKWDVIHFNWGLHDLKYINDKGGLVDPSKGKIQVPIDQYEKNLRKLVQRMKKTSGKLIWCATTPVPEGAAGRIKGYSAKYNAVAARIMSDEGVAVDDLYAFALPQLEKIQRAKNVHFSPEGSKALAKQVASHITEALDRTFGAGWISLFNGKDLTGWDGDPKLWKVDQGAIFGVSTADNPLKINQFIIFRGNKQIDADLSNIELRLKFRITGTEKANSGVQYRSRELKDVGKWVITGLQADINQTHSFTGMIYEERGRRVLARPGQKVVVTTADGKDAAKKPDLEVVGSVGDPKKIAAAIKIDDWNDYTIIARGTQLIHKVNGVTMAEVEDRDEKNRAKSGLIALQLHRGPPMKVWFKDIKVKKLAGK